MPLLRSRKKESDENVKTARLQVDLAILKLTEILDQVEEQTIQAKEELDERHAG